MLKLTLTSEDVRSACIRNNWFTQGTAADYEHMLNNVDLLCDGMLDFETENLIWDIVSDIRMHSDTERMKRESGCTYEEIGENMAYILLNSCTLNF